MRQFVFIGFVVMLCSVAGANAQAGDSNPRVYAYSSSPYWEVGRLDTDLSRLCSLDLFNQKQIAHMYIQFTGDVGRGVAGIALKGWNLRDPKGVAAPGPTYYFHGDGTSNCKVFVAP